MFYFVGDIFSSGGIVMASRDGKIVIENTLDARLDVLFRKKLPEVVLSTQCFCHFFGCVFQGPVLMLRFLLTCIINNFYCVLYVPRNQYIISYFLTISAVGILLENFVVLILWSTFFMFFCHCRFASTFLVRLLPDDI